jgi:glutaconate CoA-transferase subunit A/glutaconate CoA-transferase subunit B
MCVCIARQAQDGAVLAQGIATPLVMAGYMLAKLTRAPNVVFASAISQGLVSEWAPLALARVEDHWLGRAHALFSFPQVACDMLPRFHFDEFLRPAQADAQGNTNNVFVGAAHDRPQMRLPGAGGIPDVTTYNERLCLYVPRHSRAVFVDKLDFVSGLGHSPLRRAGAGPRYCVTNLGEFDYAHGRMRLARCFPGVSPAAIQARTGFALELAPAVGETELPTAEEVRLLREVIDPLGVRKLETLSGAARKELLRDILSREGAL